MPPKELFDTKQLYKSSAASRQSENYVSNVKQPNMRVEAQEDDSDNNPSGDNSRSDEE